MVNVSPPPSDVMGFLGHAQMAVMREIVVRIYVRFVVPKVLKLCNNVVSYFLQLAVLQQDFCVKIMYAFVQLTAVMDFGNVRMAVMRQTVVKSNTLCFLN